MSYFLAVKFFHFFWTCCWAKEMIHLNKNSWTPAQKIDLENSLQQSLATLSFFFTFRYVSATFKGNGQFIFLCNPQKSLVNVCLMKNLKSTVTKKSNCVFLQFSWRNLLKVAAFVIFPTSIMLFFCNPSKVQRSLFERIARFL